MNGNLYIAPMGLLTTLLIFLVVCSAAVENRAAPTSAVSGARKPPFNGSIFGKRTVLPALQGLQDGYNYIPMTSNEDSGSNYAFDLPDRGQQMGPLLLQQQQQQETLIRLAISQCLAQQQRQEGDSVTSALCASLTTDPKGYLRRGSSAGLY